ncbi:MAG: HDOD domain-containing protein [Deltaproteobacteria bacterium]|nr:HDOD domain-containing protein [Deltaproteobacteria bacterium]
MLNLDNLKDTDLPPLKPMVAKLWGLLNAPDTRLAEIAEAMGAEPVLCARIMAVANSPIYRGTDEITSVHKALVRLGLQEVKGVVYYLTLAGSVRKNTLPASFSIRRFWTHSLCTALLSEKLIKFHANLFPMTQEEQEGAYLSGLLHDMGYVVMGTLMPEAFTTLAQSWEHGGHDPLQLEESLFGVAHPVISAKALKLWKFPKNVQLAVYAHHRDVTTGNPPAVVTLLKVADCLATGAGYHFNPMFTLDMKQSTIPAGLMDNDFQPIVEEVSLKVELLVGQNFS